MSSSNKRKAAKELAVGISPEHLARAKKLEIKPLKASYLCSKCNATNLEAHEDHKTDLECRKAWQNFASQLSGGILVAKRKIAEHQRIRHMGFKDHNADLDLCVRCLFTGFSAFQHAADIFGVMPKNRGKGGFVNGLGPSSLPRETMQSTNPEKGVPLSPPLDPAPATDEGAPRGDVEPGSLLSPPFGPLG